MTTVARKVRRRPFTINYMDVVPFDLSSIVRPPSPGAPHPPSPPVPHPSLPASPYPPTPPTRPVSPSVSEGHHANADTDRPGTPVMTLMLGCAPTHRARAALMMTLQVTVPVLVPVPVQPSLSARRRRRRRRRWRREAGSFLWTAQWSWSLLSPRPRCQCSCPWLCPWSWMRQWCYLPWSSGWHQRDGRREWAKTWERCKPCSSQINRRRCWWVPTAHVDSNYHITAILVTIAVMYILLVSPLRTTIREGSLAYDVMDKRQLSQFRLSSGSHQHSTNHKLFIKLCPVFRVECPFKRRVLGLDMCNFACL